MRSGIVNVYKEKGYTSFDVVARLRGILGERKIGHTGTLDPDAEGVLPVCVGKGTKLCGMLTGQDKEYEAVLLLGRITDTQDISGAVLEEHPVKASEEEVLAAAASFVGEYSQIPPMYSARKIHGRKLYELAREGRTVEREPRQVQISEIEVQWVRLPRARMRVRCSKGTYIRTLCEDMGRRLGCGGCMEELLRTRVGGFTLETARKLADIEALEREGRAEEFLLPVEEMFSSLPRLLVRREYEKAARNGNKLEAGWLKPWGGDAAGACGLPGGGLPDTPGEQACVFLEGGLFAGVYALQGDGVWKPVRIFL